MKIGGESDWPLRQAAKGILDYRTGSWDFMGDYRATGTAFFKPADHGLVTEFLNLTMVFGATTIPLPQVAGGIWGEVKRIFVDSRLVFLL